VRDLDLMAGAGLVPALVKVVARRRTRAGRQLQAFASRFPVGVWRKAAGEAVTGVAGAASAAVVHREVDRRLRSITARFVKRADRRLRHERSIHRLRIAGKKLRYALEVSASIVPVSRGDEGEVLLRRIQDRFGTAMDHAVVAASLRGWADEEADSGRRRAVLAAHERTSKQARKAKRACLDWWTVARRKRFLRRLEMTVDGRPA
jgi:CHAD domain-containing protein